MSLARACVNLPRPWQINTCTKCHAVVPYAGTFASLSGIMPSEQYRSLPFVVHLNLQDLWTSYVHRWIHRLPRCVDIRCPQMEVVLILAIASGRNSRRVSLSTNRPRPQGGAGGQRGKTG